MTTLIRELVADLRPLTRPARVLYAGGAFWLGSALVHLVPLAADGWAWSGAVSFRKPLVFSLSVGLLLATIGWVIDRLPRRRLLANAVAWTLLVSSSVEVGLIALQAWRGRASHFNVMQAGDAAIFGAMGAMVGLMALSLLAVLVWSVVERPSDPLHRTAVIAGLALVATGLGIGQWLISLGVEFVATSGAVPETVMYGEGVPKFPHALAFHGIQLFIVTSILLPRGSLSRSSQLFVLRLMAASYSAVLAFASLQAVTGGGPYASSVWNLGLAGAVVVTVGTLAWTIRDVSRMRTTDMDLAVPVA